MLAPKREVNAQLLELCEKSIMVGPEVGTHGICVTEHGLTEPGDIKHWGVPDLQEGEISHNSGYPKASYKEK